MLFEVCIDSVEGALAAREGGAQRVELCAGLVEGGLTPSLGMIEMVRRVQPLRLHVLIRPRGGDFFYSDLEYAVMQQDVLAAKQAGADGVVLGLLQLNGQVDVPRTAGLIALARPMAVTFHRAFDLCCDPAEALEALIALGVERVLTSGQKASALEGQACIAGLVRQAAGRITVLAGGGINAQNAAELIAATLVSEIHFSARETTSSPMQFRLPGVSMGKAYTPDEYSLKTPRSNLVRAVVQAAGSQVF